MDWFVSSCPDLQPLLSLQQRSVPVGEIPALKRSCKSSIPENQTETSELSPKIPRDDGELRWRKQEVWGVGRDAGRTHKALFLG